MNFNIVKKYLIWIFSVFVNAFGNFLMIQSDLGNGPWIAASMGISLASFIPIGVCTIILNFLVYIPIIIISKKFEIIRFLASFFVAYIFGYFLDFFLVNFSWIHSNSLTIRVLLFFLGDMILSAGISVYLRINIGLNPFDQFLQTVNEFLIKDIRKANLVYLGVPIFIATFLGLFNDFNFRGIGFGTIFMFLFNGIFIKFFHKKISIPTHILSAKLKK